MKNLRIEQFVKGTLIEFNDGEIWVVSNGYNAHREEVALKPYNELAKSQNISLAIAYNLEDIKAFAVTIIF